MPTGILDKPGDLLALIGDPPPLQEHSRSAEAHSPNELCPFLEPKDNWTRSQVKFAWTSEGTDEFLGHGDKAAPTKSPDRCLVQTQRVSSQ